LAQAIFAQGREACQGTEAAASSCGHP